MGELITTSGGLALLGGRVCLDFCNTVVRRPELHDTLASGGYQSLVHWFRDVGLIPPELANHYADWEREHAGEAFTLFKQAAKLREAIYQVGAATVAVEAASVEALTTLDYWTHRALHARHLSSTTKGKLEWQWHDPNAVERPLWDLALSAIDLFLNGDLARLRQCPGCGWLFYDKSKNNTRNWCDMRFCGNRAKSKRFHARSARGSASVALGAFVR